MGTKSPNGYLVSKNEDEENVVEIIAYCLNPNHYHLILKQLVDGGISKFMLKLSSGYATYFNRKNNRSGSLFQGPFKSIHIDTNEYLLYLSAYVNRNDFVHGYEDIRKEEYTETKETRYPIGELVSSSVSSSIPKFWNYSSYLDYIGKREGRLCKKETILNQFKSKKEYQSFIEKTSLHPKNKKEIEKYLLE